MKSVFSAISCCWPLATLLMHELRLRIVMNGCDGSGGSGSRSGGDEDGVVSVVSSSIAAMLLMFRDTGVTVAGDNNDVK